MKLNKVCLASLLALSIFTLGSCGKKTTKKNSSSDNTTTTTKVNTTAKPSTTKSNLKVVNEGNMKYVITLDKNDNDSVIYCYYKDGNKEIPYGSVYREYDSKGRVTDSHSYTYDSKKQEYVGYKGFSKTYDDKGRLQQETEIRFDSEKKIFYIAFWYVYEFDELDRVVKTTVQRGYVDTNSLKPWSINTTTYGENTKTINRAYYSTSTQTYSDTHLETITYDSKKRVVSDDTKLFGKNDSLVEYEYDDDNNLTTEIRYTTDSDKNYVPREKSVITGDIDYPTHLTRYGYDNGYYIDVEYDATYDEYGMMEYIQRTWDGTEFVNSQRVITVTDKYDLYAYKALYTWNGTSWVEQEI